MYKQWMSRQQVSADDIISWLNNPANCLELYSELLKCLYKSWYFRFYSRFKCFIYEHMFILEKNWRSNENKNQ